MCKGVCCYSVAAWCCDNEGKHCALAWCFSNLRLHSYHHSVLLRSHGCRDLMNRRRNFLYNIKQQWTTDNVRITLINICVHTDLHRFLRHPQNIYFVADFKASTGCFYLVCSCWWRDRRDVTPETDIYPQRNMYKNTNNFLLPNLNELPLFPSSHQRTVLGAKIAHRCTKWISRSVKQQPDRHLCWLLHCH